MACARISRIRKTRLRTLACALSFAAIAASALASPETGENYGMTPAQMQRLEEQFKPRTAVQIDPKILDNYVGYYLVEQGRVMTVTREDDHLLVAYTAQPPRRVVAENPAKFFYA